MDSLAPARPAAERLSSAAHDTVNKLADSARPAVERLASGAHQTVDRIASAAAATAARLGNQTEQLNAARARARQVCSTYVQEKPLAALGIAVVAGFLLGRLLSSR